MSEFTIAYHNLRELASQFASQPDDFDPPPVYEKKESRAPPAYEENESRADNVPNRVCEVISRQREEEDRFMQVLSDYSASNRAVSVEIRAEEVARRELAQQRAAAETFSERMSRRVRTLQIRLCGRGDK
ncbi:uncharacterized protein E0L32_000938 [Thyridium curvatum]|uniref:Uncharacterized protein n=1 Tax=Thyridium curvatum TaxID=1093900 RepID=A0A507B6U1_9PEZI|nr:uncharacterized protein E0L32_000938 [Thyridium curvatum]TPX12761.1 hypothetical protein E0L32_000938 [Thyridium curvatum]